MWNKHPFKKKNYLKEIVILIRIHESLLIKLNFTVAISLP